MPGSGQVKNKPKQFEINHQQEWEKSLEVSILIVYEALQIKKKKKIR